MTKTAFAFDLGNGYVKATNGKRTIVAPSMIARETSVGTSSLLALTDQKNNGYETYESQLDDGVKYIWGEGIADAVEPEALIPTYTHNNRYTQKRFKLLCTFILSELASDFTDEELMDVTIVTALPSAEIGTEDESNYKKFLEQKHVMTRNGQQRVINVTDVRIVEQPTGTLLNLYMNDEGLIDEELLTSTITVVDFGAGTTIMDTFKNFKRLSDKSETFYEGMNDLHRIIAKELEQKHNIKGLDPSYVDEGFRRNDLVAVVSERRKYSFEDIAKHVIMDFIDKRLSEIDRTLTNRDSVDKFVVTGGGVNIIKDYFTEVFGESNIVFAENSQTANLKGYYKLASNL
ncbi:MAG TPA: hypothetical protein VK121_08780 [Pseudogracilibacillus sp.]|nr:hypothetical protein [Pseudogracilibacillus sp.]